MSGWRMLAAGLAAALTVAAADNARVTPVLFQSAPGQVEVAALDASAAQVVVSEAGEAWRALAGVLGLPEAFSSAVLVRVVPAAEWSEAAPFRVTVEPGGVVSVRLRWSEATPLLFVRRALVQALLLRLAVAEHGVTPRLTVPLWLEQAGVAGWQTRMEPAQLDAIKRESLWLAPPALADVLGWQRSDVEPRALAVGALWLLEFLKTEAGGAAEWRGCLKRLLGGEEPGVVVKEIFGANFRDDRERELWWQTGWHQLRRQNALPGLSALESRRALAEAARFVFIVGGREQVVPLEQLLRRAREPAVMVEVKARLATVNHLLPALHPFYRNAGLSLVEALTAAAPALAVNAAGQFSRDWRDATELDDLTEAALDAQERGLPTGK